jgi:hypothetical protein
MAKTLYMVQINLGGLSGPFKMIYNESLGAYFSPCGDFECGPNGCTSDGIWQRVFFSKRDADSFVEGIRFLAMWNREVIEKGFIIDG